MDGSGGQLGSGDGQADGQADDAGDHHPQLGSAGWLTLGSGRRVDQCARAGKSS